MKKKEYVKIWKKKLDEGHALFQHKTNKDSDGDPLHRTFPAWIELTALSAGWVKVSTTEPVGVHPPEEIKNEVEGEYNEAYQDALPESKATKGAIEFANENEIDLSAVAGTGRGGKITLFDVKNYLENG